MIFASADSSKITNRHGQQIGLEQKKKRKKK
jgi:hypothetical protein